MPPIHIFSIPFSCIGIGQQSMTISDWWTEGITVLFLFLLSLPPITPPLSVIIGNMNRWKWNIFSISVTVSTPSWMQSWRSFCLTVERDAFLLFIYFSRPSDGVTELLSINFFPSMIFEYQIPKWINHGENRAMRTNLDRPEPMQYIPYLRMEIWCQRYTR